MDLKKELVKLEDIYICDDDKENIRRLYRIIGIIEEALDCLKMNFMLVGQDEFGNEIDFICYKQEERTLLERKQLLIDYINELFTDSLIKEIKENYKEDEIYRRLRNIYSSLFCKAILNEEDRDLYLKERIKKLKGEK